MKFLQDEHLKSYLLNGNLTTDTYVQDVQNPKEVFLLLHGFGERGKRIFRKLKPFLPKDALIIAPNAPFPLTNQGQIEGVLTFAWYFYDTKNEKYLIGAELAKSLINDIIRPYENLPLTIIGFSQGGYLASGLIHSFPSIKKVIGIGCEFRENIIKEFRNIDLVSIHGKKDTIISYDSSLEHFTKIKKIFPKAQWFSLETLGHEINEDVGTIIQKLTE